MNTTTTRGRASARGERPGVDRPITRDDIEAKLREIAGPVERGVEQAKSVALVAAVAIGTVLVVGAYLLGRRKGRQRSAILEIRRI